MEAKQATATGSGQLMQQSLISSPRNWCRRPYVRRHSVSMSFCPLWVLRQPLHTILSGLPSLCRSHHGLNRAVSAACMVWTDYLRRVCSLSLDAQLRVEVLIVLLAVLPPGVLHRASRDVVRHSRLQRRICRALTQVRLCCSMPTM